MKKNQRLVYQNNVEFKTNFKQTNNAYMHFFLLISSKKPIIH